MRAHWLLIFYFFCYNHTWNPILKPKNPKSTPITLVSLFSWIWNSSTIPNPVLNSFDHLSLPLTISELLSTSCLSPTRSISYRPGDPPPTWSTFVRPSTTLPILLQAPPTIYSFLDLQKSQPSMFSSNHLRLSPATDAFLWPSWFTVPFKFNFYLYFMPYFDFWCHVDYCPYLLILFLGF